MTERDPMNQELADLRQENHDLHRKLFAKGEQIEHLKQTIEETESRIRIAITTLLDRDQAPAP